MIFGIKCNYKNEKEIRRKLKGGFDNPKVSKVYCVNQIFFSGWFISEYNALIKMKASYDNGIVDEYSLNTVRPDVVKVHHLTKDSELCGFKFVIDLLRFSCPVSVSVEINEESYEIWKIHPVISDQPKIFWESFHDTKKDKSLDNNSQKNIKNIESFLIHSEFNTESTENVYNLLSQDAKNSFNNISEFNGFIESFKAADWSLKAIEKSYNENELRYTNDSGLNYYCIASFIVADCNFLLFSGLGVKFYLAQHCENVLLIFPTIYKYIILNQPWVDHVINQFKGLPQNLIDLAISGYVLKDKPSTFGGVNLSCNRPYHFVYDYLYGMESLDNKGLYLDVFSNKGYCFLDPSLIFDNVSKFEMTNETIINNSLFGNNQYLIIPSFRMNNHFNIEADVNAHPLINSLTDRLKKTTFEGSSDLDLDSYDLVFWCGICDEKRKWVEQEEGIISIIEKLNNKYENLCIILDGTTSLLNKETANYENSNEYKLFESIKSNFSNVTFINLINKSMLEKIYVSSKVDCFLTSYLTDSMYVSFIQGKKGVTYIAPSIKHIAKGLHIHRNILEVPNNKIHETENKGWDKVSVSMDWHDVYECILTVLNEN